MFSGKRKVWAPVALALLLIAVDKIVYIPAVQACCVNAGSAQTFRNIVEYNFDQEEMISAARTDGRRVLMNFGSSRSLAFYPAPTASQVAADPFLNPAEKSFIDRWELVNNAYPGASLLSSYVRFSQWIDHGVRPDAILLEMDPALLNGRTRWSATELKFGVPLDFALRNIGEMPWEHTHTILGGRLFAMSRYRLGRPVEGMGEWERLLGQLTEVSLAHRDEAFVLTQGYEPGKEPPLQQIVYLRATQVMELELFNNFRIDPNLARYASLIVKRARREGLPVFIWLPPQHTAWRAVVERRVDRFAWQRLLRGLEKDGAQVIRLDRPKDLRCQQFIDPVHFAQFCAPEISARLALAVEAVAAERGALAR